MYKLTIAVSDEAEKLIDAELIRRIAIFKRPAKARKSTKVVLRQITEAEVHEATRLANLSFADARKYLEAARNKSIVLERNSGALVDDDESPRPVKYVCRPSRSSIIKELIEQGAKSLAHSTSSDVPAD